MNIKRLSLPLLCLFSTFGMVRAEELSLDDLFPNDRVLDVQITVAKKDWDTIRKQSRNFLTALSPKRQFEPVKGPYTYVKAKVTIDGVEFPDVGLRKKGFIGSQSILRPSLKVKLNFTDKKANIGGLTNLTLNNNKQDRTLVSQYMGYSMFRKVGLPACRCSFAKVTVNGRNLGVYSHVETVREPLLKRTFGTDQGTLYEGTVIDFVQDWDGGFERKLGDDKIGREKIKQLIAALQHPKGNALLTSTDEGRALAPIDDTVDGKWMATNFDDSAWRKGKNGAGFETQRGYEKLISKSFDFKDELYEKNSSLYLRFPFQVDDLAKAKTPKTLALLMKYDDGFVAYLNGHKVASANAPKELNWKSSARGAKEAGSQFDVFDISDHKDKLQQGRNVLAIHGMNSNSTSSDMVFLAEIRAYTYEGEKEIGKVVDLDAFYKFWATESLLGFWDGYSGNCNNYFVYLHPETKKFHFLPWGADALFISRGAFFGVGPVSVQAKGLVSFKLYQTLAGRQRYAKVMNELLEKHWDEDALVTEIERIQTLLKPYLSESQELTLSVKSTLDFIRKRRKAVTAETKGTMPIWKQAPAPMVVMNFGNSGRARQTKKEDDINADTIWNAARKGDVDAIQKHLDQKADINARNLAGETPLDGAVAWATVEAVEFLLDKGADINAKNREQRTAIHRAAFWGRGDIIELLLAKGADVNSKTSRGETPVDTASRDWRRVQQAIELQADRVDREISLKQVKAARESVVELLRKKGGKAGKEL